MNEVATSLLKKIMEHEALVGIIGLGYVGLPLALCFTEKRFKVFGFDVDPEKVEKLNRGECYIKHLDPNRLKIATGNRCEHQTQQTAITNDENHGNTSAIDCDDNSSFIIHNSSLNKADEETNHEEVRFTATSDFSRLSECDAILICVPTPLGKHKEPDLSYVENSTKSIRKTLRKGQLIILESTTYPGTTDELLKDILESPISEEADENAKPRIAMECDEQLKIKNSELRIGTDFFLAFSPEREDPGNPDFGTKNIPKVVGGVDEISGDLAEALYAQVLDSTVRVKNARTAESTKLMENIFRAVNIALVNELKMVFEKMDVDIWDVLDAAETKPFGFMRFNPGPGWGGHCIGLDPFYLAWKAKERGQRTRFIELAGEINIEMPKYVIEKLTEALNEQGKALKGSKILILGLAYKPDIDDPRESPAFEVIELLLDRGSSVGYHDPHIPIAPRMRSWPNLPAMQSTRLIEEDLATTDAAIVVTNHVQVDYELVLKHVPLVIDTRGAYRDKNRKIRKA